MTKELRQAQSLARRQRLVSWPSCSDDVTPYGLEASLEAVCAWVPYLPHHLTIQMVCRYIGFAFHWRFILSTVIPRTCIPAVSQIVADWETRSDDLVTCGGCLNNLDMVAQFASSTMNLDSHCMAAILHSKPVGDWNLLVKAFGMALSVLNTVDAMPQVTQLHLDENFGLSRLPTIAHTFEIMIARLHILLRLPDGSIPGYDLAQSQKDLDDFNKVSARPSTALASWSLYLYGGHVCGAPGCKTVSTERRLKMCTRCIHVFYCSRACQKRAWKHPIVAHRDICATLQVFSALVDPVFAETPKTEDSFRRVCYEVLTGNQGIARDIIEHFRVLYCP